MATRDGSTVDATLQTQPEPGAGQIQPVPDGREYWRRRALASELRALRAENLVAQLLARIAAAGLDPGVLGST